MTTQPLPAPQQPTAGTSSIIYTPAGGNQYTLDSLATSISWTPGGVYTLLIEATNVFLNFSIANTYIGPGRYTDASQVSFEFQGAQGGWALGQSSLSNYIYVVTSSYSATLSLALDPVPPDNPWFPGLTSFVLAFTPASQS
jgi:hypothetical protein